jgi:hypothetical protein
MEYGYVRRQKLRAGIIALFFLANPLYAQSHAPIAPFMNDVKISASTSDKFDFEFRPASWTIDTLRESGATSYRFNFPDAIVDEQPGDYQIPYKVVVLGIPIGGKVQVEVTPGPFSELPNVELARVLEFRPDEELGEWRLPPAAPAAPGFYPAELALADAPAWYRHQEIVRLRIAPLQYEARTKTVRRYESLAVRVRFIGGKSSAPGLEPSGMGEGAQPDPFYEGLLANAAMARNFRNVPSPAESRLSKSITAAGPFYKINIRKEGLYRITGQFLASRGIALADINPATLQMFNNGGTELPREMNASRPQGLEEIRIWVEDGNDGRFDASDFILFYGKGVDGFQYDPNTGQPSHYLHHYVFDNVYWLTWGAMNGKRIGMQQTQPTAGATVVTDFRDRFYVEQELHPLYESGLHWYGWLFTSDAVSRTRRYRFTLNDVVAGGTAQYKFTFLGWSAATHQLDIKVNETALLSSSFFGQHQYRSFLTTKTGGLKSGENTLDITYSPSISTGQVFIDYFEVAYDRALKTVNSTLAFDGRIGGEVYAYQLEGANDLWLFDVSDYRNVQRLDPAQIQFSGTQAVFADSTGAIVPRRYLAASPNATPISNLQADVTSNWRSTEYNADLVIITHEDFYSEAMRLKSLHENLFTDDRHLTEVVKIQDVFDEFSGGLYDATAIRDFLKYAFDHWQKPPGYVLLFGDGDHDPKNILDNTDKNWIPTYQTTEYDDIGNRTTDHWFTYVSGNDAVMDMAIGRIPSRSPQQAKDYVDKVVAYLDPSQADFGHWRNTLLFVADDDIVKGIPSGADRIHITDTEDLSKNYTPQEFDIRKLYLTEYPGVQSASISGIRKPSATEALLRQINGGALIVNYVGHGAPLIWSDERVLNYATDFYKIQNGPRQALWVTATCDFGRFDNPKEQSFAEEILLAPGRGAIAMLATTRLVYAGNNAAINKEYYFRLFSSGGVTAPIGLALMQARARLRATTNDEKFHILADPAIRLTMPRQTAQVTSIEPDTITALSVMTVRGTIQRNGAPWNDFNGQIYLETLDSRRSVIYQSPVNVMNYNLPGNAMFRGTAPVDSGRFRVQFFVPKDITYGGSQARINMYFSGQGSDGRAAVDNLPVGGTALNFIDQAGPEISIGFAGVDDFVSGGVVGLNPILKVVIADSLSGINITGEIGHKVTLALDDEVENKIDLTGLFNYESGSFKRGVVLYPLAGLSEGRHTALVKAWDNFNNSSTASVEFATVQQDRLTLDEVMNYPNPFRRETSFTFVSSHDAEVRVKIFTLSGRLIRTLDPFAARRGFNMISWDGEDGDGDTLANGVYLYKLIATSNNGAGVLRAETIGKMVVVR